VLPLTSAKRTVVCLLSSIPSATLAEKRPAIGVYAVDPKAAYEVMRAWRAYSRDLEQSCSGASSLRHKVVASIIALMFALGFAGWFVTFSPSLWR